MRLFSDSDLNAQLKDFDVISFDIFDALLCRPDTTLSKELLSWESKITLQESLPKTIQYFKGF